MPVPEILGSALRNAREKNHLSVSELAARSGISRAMIADVERGKNVSVDTIEKLATALGVTSLPIGASTAIAIRGGAAAHVALVAERIAREADEIRRAILDFAENEANISPAADVFTPPAGKSVDLAPLPFRRVRIEIEPTIEIPIRGYVAAGAPIDALNHDDGETRTVPVSEAPASDLIALVARGDSMTEFGIQDGDLVYAEPRRGGVAATGEIVIGWLNDGLVIKKWERRAGKRRLVSGNTDYPPREITPADTWELQAIVRYRVPRIRGEAFPNLSGKRQKEMI